MAKDNVGFSQISIDPGPGLTLSEVTEGQVLFLRSFISFRYAPQPDITAYELALILPYLFNSGITEADWDALGTAKRHLPRV